MKGHLKILRGPLLIMKIGSILKSQAAYLGAKI